MDIVEGGRIGNDAAWPTIEELFPGADPMPPGQHLEEAVLCKSLINHPSKFFHPISNIRYTISSVQGDERSTIDSKHEILDQRSFR